MSTALTLPSIHLNGTSREMLLDGYTEAYRKLIEFRDAFNNIEAAIACATLKPANLCG